MKRFLSLLFGVMLLVTMSACSKEIPKDEVPSLSVTTEKAELPSLLTLSRWNGKKSEQADPFQALLAEVPNADALPYVKLGQTIDIELNGNPPDSCTLTDQLLTSDGALRYASSITKEIPLTFRENRAQFQLEPNYATALSSNTDNYQPGATIRGFHLTVSWGEDHCEYVFALRTDAF